MDHPRSSSRRLLSGLNLRRPRVQIALTAILILTLLGVAGAILAAGTSTITIQQVSTSPIPEGAGTASFQIGLSDPIADGSVTVTVSTHDGTGANGATAGSDYTAVTQIITFTPASQAPVTISVPITQDAIDELNETFTLDLTSLTNTSTTTILLSAPITAVIQDDDSPNLTSLITSTPSVNEGAGSASFTAAISATSPQPVTLNWHLVGISGNPATIPPAAPADVALASGSWVIPIGAVTQNFTIGIVDDTTPETTEQFRVVIDSVVNVANSPPLPASIDITITDNDTTPTVATNLGVTVLEGASGTITQARLETTDPEQAAALLTYTIGTAPVNGQLFRNAVALAAASTFTQADINGGLITYTHNGSETTTDSFTFTVSDGNTSTTIQTFNITVTPVNDPPAISPQTFSIAENSPNATAVGTVVATDPDNVNLTYTITAGNTGTAFAINPTTGAITVADTTQLNFEVTPSFSLTVQVSDGALNASATITINLTNVNEAPVVTNQTFSIAENSPNTTAVGTVVASDPEGAAVTYSITGGTGSTAFAINPTTGAITVLDTTQLNFEVTPSFSLTVQVSDGALTASATITINLTNVNEAPVVDANGAAAGIDSATAYTERAAATPITTASLTVSDQENDSITSAVVTITNLANGAAESLAVTPSGGITSVYVGGTLTLTGPATPAAFQTVLQTLTYANTSSNPGTSRTISIVATDNGAPPATSSPATQIVITITTVNDPPTVVAPGLTVNEGGTANITAAQLSATDPDTLPANLVFTITSLTTNGQLQKNGSILSNGSTFTQADIGSGLLSYVHNGSETTTDSFTFTLTDGTTALPAQAFPITIVPTNDAPVLTLTTGPTAYQLGATPVVIDAGATVTDIDSLNFNGGQLRVTIASGAGAGDSLSVRNEGTAAGQISKSGLLISFGGVQIGAIGSSTTATTLVITLNTNATPAAVQALARNITFSNTAASTTPGSRVATFTVNDGGLDSVPQSKTITFNQPPLAVNDTATVAINSTTSITVLANDSDADSDVLTVTAVTQGAHGTVVIAAAGANVTYTPAIDYLGPDSFTYTISDGRGGSATATVQVTVNKAAIYLPLIMKPAYADLKVSFTVTPTTPTAGQPTNITVTVTNIGDGPASNFWVDFYIDPTSVPQVNDRWNDLCRPEGFPCYGLAWYYTDTLAPGQSVVLNSNEQSTSNPNGFKKDASIWPGYFYNGVTKLYTIADSWNRDASGQIRDPQGAIYERDESNNGSSQDITVDFGFLPARVRLNRIDNLSARN